MNYKYEVFAGLYHCSSRNNVISGIDRHGLGIGVGSWKLLRTTARDVLDNHPDGTVTIWSNENTGTSGKIKVLTTEHKNDMLCRQTSFETNTTNFGGRSVFLLCKAEDGTWKVADNAGKPKGYPV